MQKVALDVESVAYRLLNPGCVVIVSVGDGERDNLFTVTWNMPVRKKPPMAALLSGKRHFSYPLIEKTRAFGINLMDASLVDAVYGCGACSGRDVEDKFQLFDLTRQPSEKISAPLVHETVANLECRVRQLVDLDGSALILAEIVAAHGSPSHFVDGMWSFGKGLQLLHHLSGRQFCTSERVVEARRPEIS